MYKFGRLDKGAYERGGVRLYDRSDRRVDDNCSR